jgi:hypothetical protein
MDVDADALRRAAVCVREIVEEGPAPKE